MQLPVLAEDMTLARIFVFIGGLLVLVLFTALIGPLFIDWTSYRQDFEREASRILGRDVTVNGSADARLIPFPSVTFNDVEVGETSDGEPMIAIERFSMDAELAPFLSGEIRIFDMRIEEPRVRVDLARNGALAWADRAGAGLSVDTVILESVQVTDGRIEVTDRQNSRSYTLENVDGEISARSLAGPWRIEGAASLRGERAAFAITTGERTPAGTIRLRTRLLPDSHPISIETEGTARIEDMRPSYDGSFTVQALDLGKTAPADAPVPVSNSVALRGTGLFEVDTESLRVGEYRLEVGTPDDPYVVTGEATIDTGEEPEFLLIADGQQVDLDRLGSAAGGIPPENQQDVESEPPVSLAERIDTFRSIIEAVPVPDLPGRVSLVLPAIIAGETTLREVSIEARPNGESWLVDDFSAALPGRTVIEADGELGLGADFGFSGNMVLASNQPSGFASWLTDDVDPAIRSLRSAGFEAEVLLREGLQRFKNLELAAGDATLTGRFERSVQDDRPSLSFDLAGDRFDLDTLGALAGLFGNAGDGALAGHDVAARLRSEDLSAFGFDMAGVDTAFTLRDGLLDIERLRVAELAGASFSGRGVFSDLATNPQGTARIEMTAEDPAALARLLDSRLGRSVNLRHFAENGDLFSATSLTADIQLGSARETPENAVATGYDIQIEGLTGGTRVDFSASSEERLSDGLDAPLSAVLRATSDRKDVLLAQLGFPALALDVGGGLTLSASLDGAVGEGAAFDFELWSDDARFEATGDLGYSRGRVRSASLETSLRAADMEPYLLLAGIALPGFGSGLPVSFEADLTADEGHWRLSDINAEFAGNAVSGNLAATRDAVPEISGDLAIDTLEAEWLAEVVLGQPVVSPVSGEWSSDEFGTTGADPFSAEIELSAGRAYFGLAEAAENLTADVAYSNGALRLAETSADWLGGRLQGGFSLGNANASAVLRSQLNLSDIRLSRLLSTFEGPSSLQGRADLSLSLEGTGRSIEALVGGLSGSGAATVLDLVIPGLDDGAFAEIVAAVDESEADIDEELARAAAIAALGQGTYRADRLSAPVTIAGGVLRASNVVVENPRATLRGDAALRAASGMIQADVEMEFDPGEEALPGATPAVDITVSGTLDDIEARYDATELSNFLSLRAYERERRRVERVQAAVLEKQRLRREAAYLRERIAERETARLAAEERARESAMRRLFTLQQRVAPLLRPAEPPSDEADETSPPPRQSSLPTPQPAPADETPSSPDSPAPSGNADRPGGLPVPPSQRIQRGALLPPPDQSAPPSGERPFIAPPEPQDPAIPRLNFEDLPGVEAPL